MKEDIGRCVILSLCAEHNNNNNNKFEKQRSDGLSVDV
jgi:hypothetical protein